MTGGGSGSRGQEQQRISNASFLAHGLDSISTVPNGLGVPLYFTDNPPPPVVSVTSSPPRTVYHPSMDMSNTSHTMPTRPTSYSSPPRYNPPIPIHHPPTSSTMRLSTSSLPSRSLPLPMPSVSTPLRNLPPRYDNGYAQSTQIAATTASPPQHTSSQSHSQQPYFTNASPDRPHLSRSHTSATSSSSLLSSSRGAPGTTVAATDPSSSAVLSDPLVVGLSRLREHLREIEDNAPSLLDQSVLRQGESGSGGGTRTYSSSGSGVIGGGNGGSDGGNGGIDPRRSIGASSSILLGLPSMRSPPSSAGNSPPRTTIGTETASMGGETTNVRRSISTTAPTSMPHSTVGNNHGTWERDKDVRFDAHSSSSASKAYRYDDDGADLTAEDISLFDLAK